MNNVFATSSFLKTFQDCISNTTDNLSLSGSHQFHAERKHFALCNCSPIHHKLSSSFFQKEWGFHLGHGCIPLSAAGSHRCWARTGASLRQQYSRYLAAVTADYPLNSPLSANRKSSIISFLHSQLSFHGCFPSGQCFRFPEPYLLWYSHLQPCYSSITYCCSEVWAPALCSKDILVLKFLCYPTAPAFLCYWERGTWQLLLLSGHQTLRTV